MGYSPRLLRDRGGISSVEFALVAGLFFTFVLGMIDVSRAMWAWNAAAKATRIGARHAVVNDMVALGLRKFSGLEAGLAVAAPVPVGTAGTQTRTCTESGCVGDPDGMDPLAFADLVRRMQRVYGGIGPENLVIEYRHIGLGFAGNPLGPDIDPAVTVKLQGLTFDLITPGLSGLVSIPMPDFATTLTGEDHRTLTGTQQPGPGAVPGPAA